MEGNLGSIIRKIRKERQITQSEMARDTGTTQAYISNIEKGKVNPSLDMLGRISNVIGIPVQVIQFMSLTSNDIPDKKKADFEKVRLPMQSLLNEAFGLG